MLSGVAFTLEKIDTTLMSILQLAAGKLNSVQTLETGIKVNSVQTISRQPVDTLGSKCAWPRNSSALNMSTIHLKLIR